MSSPVALATNLFSFVAVATAAIAIARQGADVWGTRRVGRSRGASMPPALKLGPTIATETDFIARVGAQA